MQQPRLRPFSLRVIETRSTLAAVVYQFTRFHLVMLLVLVAVSLVYVQGQQTRWRADDIILCLVILLFVSFPAHALLFLGHLSVLFTRCECRWRRWSGAVACCLFMPLVLLGALFWSMKDADLPLGP